jgi:hypothetical protein
MKIGPKKNRNLCILIFFELLEIWTKILWENVWNKKGSLPLKWKQKGKVWIMPCWAESPQAPKLRSKRRKKMDDNTSCNVA